MYVGDIYELNYTVVLIRETMLLSKSFIEFEKHFTFCLSCGADELSSGPSPTQMLMQDV